MAKTFMKTLPVVGSQRKTPTALTEQQTAKLKKEKETPIYYKSETPFGNEYLDKKFQQTVKRLGGLGVKNTAGLDPYKDAYDAVMEYGNTVYASEKLNWTLAPETKDPLGVGEAQYEKRVKQLEYRYLTNGIDDYAGLKAIYDQQGFISENQHMDANEQRALDAAMAAAGYNNADINMAAATGELQAMQETAMENWLNQNPNMQWASENTGLLKGYADFYANLDEYMQLANQAGGWEALPKTVQQAAQEFWGSAEGAEYAETTMYGQALREEQLAALNAYGDEKAKDYQAAMEIYQPYEVTDGYQTYLEEKMRSTPEGARAWLDEAMGTENEQAARDNLWFVERDAKYSAIPQAADFAEKSQAEEQKINYWYQFKNDDDKKYIFINTDLDAATDAEIYMLSDPRFAKYQYMTEEEKGVYNYLHAQENGKQQANEYLEYLEYQLDERKNEAEAQRTYDLANGNGWAAAGLSTLSVPASLARGVNYLDVLGQSIFNGDKPVNYERTAGAGAFADAARQGTMDSVDWNVKIFGQDRDVFDFLYGTTMSGLDSMAAAAAGPWGGAALLATGAAQSSMQSALDNGASQSEAILMGGAAGAFELIFEKMSIAEFLKTAKGADLDGVAKMLKNMGVNALTNATEEFNTSVFDFLAEQAIMGEKSEMSRQYQYYLDMGLTEKEAEKKVAQELAWQFGEDALGGAIMGTGMGAVGDVSGVANTKKSDKAMGQSIIGAETEVHILDRAMSFGTGSISAKAAQAYKKGKSAAKLGKVFRETLRTMDEKGQRKFYEVAFADVEKTLTERGETENVEEVATAIVDLYAGNQLDAEEMQALAGSKHGMQVAEELLGMDALESENKAQEAAETAETQQTAQKTEKGGIAAAMESAAQTAAAKMKNENGETETITQIKETDDGDAVIVTESGSETALEDANIPEAQKEIANEARGNEYAVDMMGAYNETEQENTSAGAFAKGFARTAQAAADGETLENISGIYADKLSENARQAAYAAGQRKREKQQAADQSATVKKAAKDGFDVYTPNLGDKPGLYYGKVTRDISDEEKTMLQVIQKFAEKVGLQVVVYDSIKDANGAYQKGSNMIRLSLDADYGALTKVVSHEGYHYIRDWNKDAAAKLEKMVLSYLKEADGYELDTRIQEKIAEYAKAHVALDEDAAREEIVADALLDYIGTESNFRALMLEDRNLAEKIQAWVQQMMARIRSLLAQAAENSPESRALKDNEAYYTEMLSMMEGIFEETRQIRESARQGESSVIKNDPAVQEYRQDLEKARDEDGRKDALRGLMTEAFTRTQKKWMERHPEATDAEYNSAIAEFTEALATFGRDEKWVQTALTDAGFDYPTPGSRNMALLSYAGKQAAMLEERAKEGNQKYYLKNSYDFTKPFAKQVDDFDANQFPPRDMPLLGRTPELLRKIGISDLPMVLDQTHLDYMLNGTHPDEPLDHKYDKAAIKKLPELIADPIAVIESKTRANDSVVVIVNMKSANGKDSIAALAINGKGFVNGNVIDSNVVTTVHGRKNALGLLTDAINSQSAVYYINKTEAQNLYARAGVQFPGSAVQDGLIHSIFDVGSPVNKNYMEQTDTRQFKEWFRGSKAKNKDGTPMIFYHGTPNGTFYEFKDWQYFTSNKEYADVYQNQGASSNGYKKTADNPKTYAVYLQTGKVFDTRNKKAREIFENEFFGKWGNGTPLSERGLPDWTDGDDLIEFFEENEYDYDTILLDEGGTGGYGDEVKDRGISYVIRNSNQIKSADENIGTFDPQNPDIRYSLKQSPTQPLEEGLQEDVELYAQIKESEEGKAALQILRKLYGMARRGDTYLQKHEKEALIKAGAWEKRIDGIMAKIKEETGSNISDRKLKHELAAIFNAMDRGEDVNDILMAAKDLGKDILAEAPGMMNPIDTGVKECMRILRDSRFYLTEEMKSEIRSTRYGSVKAYMQKNFGKMGIRAKAKDGKGGARKSLAEVWMELSEIMPGTFQAEATEADMPGIVDAWLETAGQRDFGGAYGQNIGAYSTDLGLSMMLEYFNLPGALAKESDLRMQFEKALLDMRTAERVKYEERIKTQRERQEMHKAKEKVIREISGNVKYLNTRIVRETNSMHVPEILKGAIIKMMEPFLNNTSVFDAQMMEKLRQAYNAMSATGVNADTEAARAFDEDVQARIENMEKKIAGRRLSQLTLDELEAVRDVTGNLRLMVTDINEMAINNRKMTTEEFGNEELMDLNAKEDAKHEWLNEQILKNITPPYFFKKIGGVLEELWYDLTEAQGKWAKWMRDARAFADRTIEKYGMAKWLNGKETIRFDTQRGETIELNRQLALSIYATWQRETMNKVQDANHLRMGGFRYPRGTKAYDGVDMKRPHALTGVDMLKIRGFLGQDAMTFADEMVSYLSNDMAKIGNSVSMQLYGYWKFTEKYYFPYQSSGDFLNSDLTKGDIAMQDASGALKGWGAAKKLQTKANNPIEIGDFMDVWAGHVNKMCIYGAFTIPTDNMNRLYNYKTPVDSDMSPTSVKQELNRVYGDGAGKYLATLIRDIAGGVRAQDRTGMGKLVRKFKKSAVAANLQVVVQQPSAIARVMAVMNPKYLLESTVRTPGTVRSDIEEMRQHSGIAIIKEMGRFDTGTGLSAVEWLQESVKEGHLGKMILGKVDKAAGWGAEKADLLTWSKIWHAVKKEIAEQAPELKIDSDEYFQTVTARFEEIINRTQVYDSVLAKSEVMRSNSMFDKMASSFMGEPTITYNMLQDAIVNVKGMGGKKKLLRATSVWVVSTAFNAMLKSLVSAMRRKDDEERTYIEKYVAEVWGNFSGDMNPIGLHPLGNAMASVFEGYGVGRLDMEILEQVNDTWDILNNEKKTFGEKLLSAMGTAGNILGVPIQNVWRDASAILTEIRYAPEGGTTMRDLKYSVFDETAPFLYKYEIWDDAATAYYNRMARALDAGDEAKYEEFKGYLMGPEKKTEQAIKTGVKKQIKEMYLDGKMEREKAEQILINQFEMKERDAYFQVEEWIAENENPDIEYSRMGEWIAAVESGENLTKVFNEYKKLGYDKGDLSSAITTEYKGQYIQLYKTNKAAAANLKAKLLTALAAIGYDRNEKAKQIDKWLKE